MSVTLQPLPNSPAIRKRPDTRKARHNVICAARSFVDGPCSKADENFFKLVDYIDALDRIPTIEPIEPDEVNADGRTT